MSRIAPAERHADEPTEGNTAAELETRLPSRCTTIRLTPEPRSTTEPRTTPQLSHAPQRGPSQHFRLWAARRDRYPKR
jgi:hypothetical protein